MERYRRRKHNIIFDGWWSCKGCHARGPGFNQRDCVNPVGNAEDETKDENDYGHRLNRRKDNEDEHYAGDEESLRTGMKANKQARKRAEEQQDE
eukprot:5465871-Heterocapsa_arctica.AAC.1